MTGMGGKYKECVMADKYIKRGMGGKHIERAVWVENTSSLRYGRKSY